MASRNPSQRLVLAVIAFETILLLAYFTRTGVAILPSQWLASFTWEPAPVEFHLGYFAAVSMLSLASMLIYAGWLSAGAIAGASILARTKWEADGPGQRTLLSTALGLGLLAAMMYALGLLGLMTPAWTYLGGGTFFLFGLWALQGRKRLNVRLHPKNLRALWDGFLQLDAVEAIVALIALFAIILHLVGALLPPLSFDEMNYQLSLPKLYVLNHGFVETPFNHLSFLPKNMSMLFTLGLLTGGAAVAKLFSWGMGMLAAAAILAFGRPRLGRRAALFGAAIFLMAPVVGNQLRVAAADLGTAFFEITALFLLLRFLDDRDRPTLILSGVLWGLALGCKYTAIPGIAAATLYAAWRLRAERPKIILSHLTLFLTSAVIIWSPWLLKNWWDTGNPVTPLLSAWITSRNFFFAGDYRPMVDYTVGLGINNYFPINGLSDFLVLPWTLTVRHNDFNHDLGPIFLMSAPLALLYLRRAPKWIAALAVVACLYWAGWLMVSVRMTRYFVAGIAATSIVAGWLLSELLAAAPQRWVIAAAMPFLLALSQQALRMTYIQNMYKRPWGYLSGRCSVPDYLYNMQPDSPYNVFAFVNKRLPKDARVLVFNEYRTFYLDRDFLASTPWDHDYWHEFVRLSASPEDLVRRLKDRRITHIIANKNYVLHHTGVERVNPDEWTAEDLEKSKRFMKACFKAMYQDNGVWLGALKS